MRLTAPHRGVATRVRSLAARILARVAPSAAPPAPENVEQGWVQLDFDPQTRLLWQRVAPLTMTSVERVDALRQAVEHVHANAIAGDVVECGVWRGGSMAAVALTLLRLGETSAALALRHVCGRDAARPGRQGFSWPRGGRSDGRDGSRDQPHMGQGFAR